jgi:hypothetical protein
MAERKYKSFKEFYPYYLTEHAKPGTQATHFIGTALVIALLVYGLATQQWILLAFIPVAGYGFAWVGHAFIERNKPATFTYPLWSLGSDFVMFWHILTFQLPSKMKEAQAKIHGDQN